MKILVTGDREWSDIETVANVLRKFPAGTVLVHGACRGADNTCAAVAESLGFVVRPYPADWRKYHRAAGPVRNQQMIDLENVESEPIDLCLAFHDDIENSRGTRDMMKRAQKAAIVTLHVTSRGLCPLSSAELERVSAKDEVAGSNPAAGAK